MAFGDSMNKTSSPNCAEQWAIELVVQQQPTASYRFESPDDFGESPLVPIVKLLPLMKFMRRRD